MSERISKEILAHKPVSSIEPRQPGASKPANNIFLRRLLLGVTVISEYLNKVIDGTPVVAPVSPRLGVDLGEHALTKAFCQRPKQVTQESSMHVLTKVSQENRFTSHKGRRKYRRNKGYGSCWQCKRGNPMHECWRKLAAEQNTPSSLPTVDPIKNMYKKRSILGLKTSGL